MARPSVLTNRRLAAPLACALAAGGVFAAAPALAQASVSQAVVQPTASPSLADLNAALKDLSRDPGNVSALVRAGWASLGIDDTQAASGFFRRAQALQPLNGEARAGLASVSLRMGVVGLIIASLLNLWLQSAGLMWAISFLGVLIFAGLTAYDTQALKRQYAYVAGTEFAGKAIVMGALSLYLDFINMFLFLLRFMGASRN